MVSRKCQAGYTTRSLPLLQMPFFSTACIVGMGHCSLFVLRTHTWKSRLAQEACFFLSKSRKLNCIVMLNSQQSPLAWKKNLACFQCPPFQHPINSQNEETLCLKCGDVLSLSRHPLMELLALLYNHLLLMWQVERFVCIIQQLRLKWAGVPPPTILWRGEVRETLASWEGLRPRQTCWVGVESVGSIDQIWQGVSPSDVHL